MKEKIAILGSGSWATALVKIFSENNHPIGWWVHKEKSASHIKKYGSNPSYLKELVLPLDKLTLHIDINEVITHYDYIILAIPASFLAQQLEKIEVSIKEKIFISSIKGIIPSLGLTPIDYLKKHLKVEDKHLGIIAGACHAEEVALSKSSYLTIAFKDKKKAEFIASRMDGSYLQTHLLSDLEGVNLASITKNIFSIASGIAKGLGYGDNFQAVLVSNAIKEMFFFIEKIAPLKRDIFHASYLGDLLVTSYSPFSRNRKLGEMIGEGLDISLHTPEKINLTAEGYHASKGIYENYTKKLGLTFPIMDAVYKILHKNQPPDIIFKELALGLN